MTTPRRVVILLGVAVIVIAGALLLSMQNSGGSITAGDAVLPGLEGKLNEVTEVRLVGADGKRTTLKRGESSWLVAEREFAADPGRVRKLLLDLTELEVIEQKTSDPANYAQLGVQDVEPGDPAGDAVVAPGTTGTLVEAVTPAQTFGLIVGKNAGTKSSYVRVADEAGSVLASPQIIAEADPKRWLDRIVLEIPQERVKEVSVVPEEGPAYTAVRDSKEQADFTVPDLPKGRELSSPSAANGLASNLASFSLDDVQRAPQADDAKDKSKPRVTFWTFNGLQIELAGRPEGERHFVSLEVNATGDEAKAEADQLNTRFAGWELEIPGYKYDGLFRPLEELLASKD